MNLYRGHFTELGEDERLLTYSLLAPSKMAARSMLRARGKGDRLKLLKVEDLGTPSNPPPLPGEMSGEDKLLAALFRDYELEYGMPQDYLKWSWV